MSRGGKPAGWFKEARGAERMRQSWDRARDAGLSDSDLAVLGGVFRQTIGFSKLDDEITLPELASAVGRWNRPVEGDARTSEQIQRARDRKTERIGQALRRLAAVGAIEYTPGRGGRRSVIALPAVDDRPNPHAARGVGNEANPHAARGVDDVQPPRGAGVNPHAARPPTPTRRGPQPPQRAGGRQMETDGPDRDRSGLPRASDHVDRLTDRLSAAVTVDAPPRTRAVIQPVIELLAAHLDPVTVEHLIADATIDGDMSDPRELTAHAWFALDGTPDLEAVMADRRWAINDRPDTAEIAIITAYTTGEPWPSHLDEAGAVAAHWSTHAVPLHIRAEALDAALAEGVTRPAHVDRIARRIRRDLDGQAHPALPTQPRRSAAERAHEGAE
jgi:hypothetical protein